MAPTKPYPHSLSLRQLRNQAKELHRALVTGDPSALCRIAESHPRFCSSSLAEIAAAEMALADA